MAYLETGSQGFLTGGVAVAGDLAYLATHVVDISDPRMPTLVGQAKIDDTRVNGKEWAQALVVGSTLFSIASYAGIVGAFSLETPTRPRLVGLVELPAETATNDQTGPFMAYAGGHLLVADESGGLVALDISDPSKPAIAGRLKLPGSVEGVVTDGRHAYVASDGGGFFVVDLAPAVGAVGLDRWHYRYALAGLRELGGGRVVQPLAPGPSPSGEPRGTGSCLVTSTADSGAGSLRGCVESNEGGTTITFDPAVFPLDRPATIRFGGESINVPGGDSIDGAGAGVILDGGGETESPFGVYDGGVRLSGMEVMSFTGYGIGLNSSGNTVSRMVIHSNGEGGIAVCCNRTSVGGAEPSGNRFTGNLIGLDRSGLRLVGAQEFGIFLQGADHIVGGPDPSDRNLIAGNRTGIEIDGAHAIIVEGNYLGLDARGRVVPDPPNGRPAVMGETGAASNRVIGNVVNGLIQFIDPGSSYNTIVGNLVGVDPTGNRPLGGGQILIGEPYNQIGGARPGEGNVVSGGILIGSGDVIVLGNRIDIGRDGRRLANGGHIDCAKDRCVIGGRAAGAANVIGGGGIDILADGCVVITNRVSTDPEFGEGPGISVQGGSNHVIANVVDTSGIGIGLTGGATTNVVRGNVLPRNRTGILADRSTSGNVVAGNSFLDNDLQARDAGLGNRWDDGRVGNYWSDLVGVDLTADGVFDEPRDVHPSGVDRFPLVAPP